MMRLGLVVFSFLLSVTAWSQESRMKIPKEADPSIVSVYLLNPEFRFERGASQNLENRAPLNLAMAYHLTRGSLLLEYARFTEESGNATSSIKRTHQDMVLWARYNVYQAGKLKDLRRFNLYVGGGLGGYQEEVESSLSGSSRVDKASLKIMTGAVLGAESFLFTTSNFGISFGAEVRGLFASDFDPNPTWSGVLRVGLNFLF